MSDQPSELQQLIQQMRSGDNQAARAAVDTLRDRGWLTDGSLRGANLINADLLNANIYGANLDGADLSNAIFGDTTIANVDLSDVKGLQTVKHYSPSEISISTLYRSKGQISENFLRGAGVPENLIDYLPSLVGRAVQYYSCFISYSSKDEDFCKQLHSQMQAAGLRVWFAPEEMKGGQTILEQIDQAIRLHDKLILVLSDHSMNSDWVKIELGKAARRERHENRRVLFPIRLIPYESIQAWEYFDHDLGQDLGQKVREFYIPDFSHWKDYDQFQIEFKKLVDALRNSETEA